MYYVVRGSGDTLQYYMELMGWTDSEYNATQYDDKTYAEEVARVVGGRVIPV